jgi:hypothetical protein
MIAALAVGSVGSDHGEIEALLVVKASAPSVTDGGLGSWLGLRAPRSNSDTPSTGATCGMRRTKPMFCIVGHRPSGTCGVGAGKVCGRGAEEAGVIGRRCRRVHVGDKTLLGRPGDQVP